MKIHEELYFSNISGVLRFLKFVFWGGLNTLVSFSVYCACVYIGFHIYVASILSLIVGILLGHYLNKTNVFMSHHDGTLQKYFMLWLGLYFIHITLLTIFIHVGLNAYISGIISGGLLVPVSYFFQKKIFAV